MEYNEEQEAIRMGELAARKLTGMLSAEEQAVLDEWLAQSAEHREAYEELGQGYHRDRMVRYDAPAALRRLLLRDEHKQPLTLKRSKWPAVAAIAAGVLLFLSVGIGIYRYQSPEHPAGSGWVSVPEEDVSPGNNRATLLLSDGHVFALSEEKEGIIIQQGTVSYQDGEQLLHARTISHATLTTPMGGQYQVTLPDGSRVWLNAGSSLRYPTHFTGDERRVELSGEAYFEVARNEKQPFIVLDGRQEVRVLGTAFNISAYPDETSATTTLVSGSVTIRPSSGNDRSPVLLYPGQQARVTAAGARSVSQVEVSDFTAWKSGLLVLNNADLAHIARQIERWYDVEFVMPAHLYKGTLSGVLPRTVNLSEVLDGLRHHTGLQFKLTGRRVVVSQ